MQYRWFEGKAKFTTNTCQNIKCSFFISIFSTELIKGRRLITDILSIVLPFSAGLNVSPKTYNRMMLRRKLEKVKISIL